MSLKKLEIPNIGVHLYESKHPRGNKISGHFHDHFQILYALDGEGEIELDGVQYEFSKDQVVLIVPNSTHSIHAFSKLIVLVLAFSKTTLGLENQLVGLIENHSHYFKLDLVKASETRQILRKMLFEQTNYDSLCGFALPLHLYELLLILVRLKKENNFKDANDMRSIQIKEYIDKHYFENITAEKLSLTFGMSSRYINDIYKAKYHETPLQYLQKIRVNRAKELLLLTDQEIISICFEVGYETLSTFYRTFRNLVGISPNKFRANNYLSYLNK
jgi:AraC-like DNA-binding protein